MSSERLPIEIRASHPSLLESYEPTPEEKRRWQLDVDAHNLESEGRWLEAIPLWEELIVDEYQRAVPFKRLAIAHAKQKQKADEERVVRLAIERLSTTGNAKWFAERLDSIVAKRDGVKLPKKQRPPSRGSAPRPAPTMEVAIAEDECRAAMLAKDFRKAVMIPLRLRVSRGSLEAAELADFDPARMAGELEEIFSVNPGILRGINPDIIPAVRLAAGMMYVFSVNEPVRRWLDDSLDTGIHLTPAMCSRMYAWAVMRQRKWDSDAYAYQKSPVGWRVMGVKERACPECDAIRDKWFSSDDAPEMPYPKCTSPEGCRCSLDQSPKRKPKWD